MKLSLFEKFVIETPLTRQEITKTLEENTPKKGWDLLKPRKISKAFSGELTGNKFHLQFDCGCRNSFIPLVLGTIYGCGARTRIEVSIKMRPTMFVFMAFWLIAIITDVGRQVFFFEPYAVMSILVFVVLYALVWNAYSLNIRRSKQLLLKIFHGRLLDNTGENFRTT